MLWGSGAGLLLSWEAFDFGLRGAAVAGDDVVRRGNDEIRPGTKIAAPAVKG